MASLGAFLNLQQRVPSGVTLRSLVEAKPTVEEEVNILAEAAQERQKQDAEGPSFRPANPMQDILAQEKVGAFNALSNIPFSPLAGAIAAVSPGAYTAMTRSPEGANPEVPNMLAGLDQMSLGGLIDTPMAAGLLRTKAPMMREFAPARLRGRPTSIEESMASQPRPDGPMTLERLAALAADSTGSLGAFLVDAPARVEAKPGGDIQQGQFVKPDEVPLNLNRYLAIYGHPDAKVRNRGGRPISYAVEPKAPEAVRLEREGKPYYVGKLTPEQWIEKQQAWVGLKDSPEWNEARDWYANLLSQFKDVYGEEKAPTMLVAWALSQQRASPSAGMSHVLKAQDIVGGWRTEAEGLAGLAHDRLMKALKSGDPDVGEKLADFVDASRGKTTRQWVGDDPRGGQPAPFDVHASRDVGFIDDTTIATLSKLFGPEVAGRFEVDTKGAPSDGQYAYGSKFYNGLKDVMNANLAPGERPYTAAEVQAIGWVGHQNMTGVKPEGPTAIFRAEAGGRSIANISRVAVEAAPGEGAPRLALWEKVPEERRAEATYRSLRDVAGDVATFAGVSLANRDATVGGWEQYKNPNVVFEVVGTPEGALRFAKAMGYVGQQTEAWAQRSTIKDRANAFGLDIIAPKGFDLSSTKDVARFWTESGLEAVPGLGFTPIRGKSGYRLRLVFERNVEGLSQAARQDGRDFTTLADRALKAIEASPLSGIEYEARPLDLRKAVHDWKEDPNGEGHLQGLGGRARGELDSLSRRVEESLRGFIGEAGAGGRPRGGEPPAVTSPAQLQGLTLRDLIGSPSPAGGVSR